MKEVKKCKSHESKSSVEIYPEKPLEAAIIRAQGCCEKLVSTNSEYIALKSTARQMLNEVDDATVFYEDELMGRLMQCAQLIR